MFKLKLKFKLPFFGSKRGKTAKADQAGPAPDQAPSAPPEAPAAPSPMANLQVADLLAGRTPDFGEPEPPKPAKPKSRSGLAFALGLCSAGSLAGFGYFFHHIYRSSPEAAPKAPGPAGDAADPKRPPDPDSLALSAHLRYLEDGLRLDATAAALPHARLIFARIQDHPDALRLVAEVFYREGRYPEAAKALDRAISLVPHGLDSLPSSWSALYLQLQGQLKGAETALDSGRAWLRRRPHDPDLLVAMASVQAEAGIRQGGKPDYLDSALRRGATYPPALALAAQTRALNGDFPAACRTYQTLLEIDPLNVKARRELGLVYARLRRPVEAERELRRVLAFNPEDAAASFQLGDLYFEGRQAGGKDGSLRRRRAMEYYLQAVRANPFHAQALFRVGVLLNENRQYREAIGYLERSRELDSEHIPTWLQLAFAYRGAGMAEKARDCLRTASARDPLNPGLNPGLTVDSSTAGPPPGR